MDISNPIPTLAVLGYWGKPKSDPNSINVIFIHQSRGGFDSVPTGSGSAAMSNGNHVSFLNVLDLDYLQYLN